MVGRRGCTTSLGAAHPNCTEVKRIKGWNFCNQQERMKHCGSLCTDLSTPVSAHTLKKITFRKGQEITKIRKRQFFFSVMQLFFFFNSIIMDVFVAKSVLWSQSWEQILKSGSGSGSAIEHPWSSMWEISWNSAFSKCTSSWSSKLSLSLPLMYFSTDIMQQILSCVQGVLPWGSQLYPQAKIPAAKDCKLLAFTPFSQTGLHGRQGLDRDSCMCLPVTDSLSWGKDIRFLLLSGYLSTGSCLLRHWVEERQVDRLRGQGWIGGWNNFYCLSRPFNSRQIVCELLKLRLGLFELLLKCSRSQSWRRQQRNSMQKPHGAITWKIVLSK